MDNVADQLARIAALDRTKPRRKIVVLGAGMAGLAAACELAHLNHAVSVIEATDHVGGRVRTHRFSDGEYHELGAMRIPAGHDYTRHYIAVAGLGGKLRPFITAHQNRNCLYFLRGRVSRIDEAPANLFHKYRLSAQERQVAAGAVAPAILGIHLENVLTSLDDQDRASLFGERFLTDRMQVLERQTLGEFLERRLESDDALELIGAATGLEVWWDKAVSMFLRDEIVGTGEGLDEIEGGLDQLPAALADRLGRDRIRFNTEVVAISLADGAVRLRTRRTQSGMWDSPPTTAPIEEEMADYVICTIPFGVLRGMSLDGLSALKMRAIRNLNYGASTKVLLHCRQRFWEMYADPDARIFGGASMSDQISRATYYPSDHAASRRAPRAAATRREGFRSLATTYAVEAPSGKTEGESAPGPGVLVGSYNWGRDARRLGALAPDERAAVVVDCVRHFHPEIDAHVDGAASMAWDTYRWSRGAFCFMRPGDLRSYYHDAIRPEGRIHFAGEHCSLDQGWIQGAVMSGLRAIEEIVAE